MLLALSMAAITMMGSGAAGGRTVSDTFTSDAGSRRYDVYLPDAYDGTAALPVIVMLHGCTQDAADIARGTRLNTAADDRRVLIVYPEQPATAHPRTCWTWYDEAHQSRDRGEPSLIAGITRAVMSKYRVDSSRVYIAGISAGGAMAAIVAAEYPELYAAIGVHSGVPVGAARSVTEALGVMQRGPADADALPAMSVKATAFIAHGADDAIVSPRNGELLARQWAAALGATVESKGQGPDGVEVHRFSRDGTVAVEWWSIGGVGHAWSGGSADGTFTAPAGPSVTNALVTFLLGHSLRAAPP
jgi:poly(hydroxyalkanoate) depolymerase family esterase